LLAAIGKLTAEYRKIGSNLNQIARRLNEYGSSYRELSSNVQAAIGEMYDLKYELLQKAGDAMRLETFKHISYKNADLWSC